MEYMTPIVEKIIALIADAFSINGGIIFTIIAAIIIMLLAKKKTPRGFSFKVRTSLTNIIGYSILLHGGKLGPLTSEQKKYLDEILAGSKIVKDEIASIETKNISAPDANMSYNLRTALMEINGYNELLRQTQPEISPKQKEYLDEIKKSSNYILQLITN